MAKLSGFLTALKWGWYFLKHEIINDWKCLLPSETKYEIMTFCWRLEEEEAVGIQYLNFQNKKFADTSAPKRCDIIPFPFFCSSFSSLSLIFYVLGQVAEPISGAIYIFSFLTFFAFLSQFCLSVLLLFLWFRTTELPCAFSSFVPKVSLNPARNLLFLLCCPIQFSCT